MSNSFLHSGDLGDIILSLPTIKALGSGVLFLGPSQAVKGQETFPRETITPEKTKFLETLIGRQDYIQGVEFWTGQKITHDLNNFRRCGLNLRSSNLAAAVAYAFGKTIDWTEPWLSVDTEVKPNRTIIARSPRNHNPKFDYFKWLDRKHENVFVGLRDEYTDFIQEWSGFRVKWIETRTAAELATVIASGSRFVGNQSFPFCIAEGLKKPIILEVNPDEPNVNFDRNCNVES